MIRLFSLALIAISNFAYAESYLCIAEAGAGIEHDFKEMHAALYNVSSRKYINTNEGGKWIVKELGNETPITDECHSDGDFCQSKAIQGDDGSVHWPSVFIREPAGIFSIMQISGNKKSSITSSMYMIKRRCSKI